MTNADADAAGHDPLRYAALVWEAGDNVELRPIPANGARFWTPAERLVHHLGRLRVMNEGGKAIYAGVLPRLGNGGKASDTNGGKVLWADLERMSPEEALAKVRESSLPPPLMVVDSGHGAHVYWKLDRKIDGPAHAALMDALKAFLKGRPGLGEHLDAGAMDAARIMRLPGFMNHKAPPAPCRIAYVDETAVAAPETWAAVLPRPAERNAAARPRNLLSPLRPPPPVARADLESRALAYLATLPPAISGQGGHSATYNAARVLAHDFGLPKEQALALLLEHYNPRCEPPWTERELLHKVEEAVGKPHDRPCGHLRDAVPAETTLDNGPAVDLSGIMAQTSASTSMPNHIDGNSAPPIRPGLSPVIEVVEAEIEDDGDEELPEDDYARGGSLEPLPHSLLDAPGFIHDAVEWGMAANFYPNRPLLFAATLSTLATLTARKITLDGRTYPNLYTVAVALSGVGKDAGNSLSTAILRSAGMGHCAQFEFGSAEAIEDALCDVSPAILWVCDEIDEWIGGTKNENNRGGASNLKVRRLLQLYSQSKSSIFRRAKARAYGRRKPDETPPEEIHMPHLSLYGTCTPKGFFSAFNERVAGGGFLGRMLIFEGDRRGLRRRPTAGADVPPESLAEIARYWAEHPCGTGNLASAMPDPKRVPFAPGAEDLDYEHAHHIDRDLFEKREAVHDNVGGSIYARTAEYARKLALLHAVSADPRNPVVGADAVRWGWDLSVRQSRRLIALMGRHAADTPFQELCLRVLNRLRDARGKPVTRSELLRLTRAKKADFDSAVETLNERREIQAVQIRTKTKTADGYRLRLRQKTPV